MTKCAGEPAGHHRASALQKSTKNVGGVANAGEDNTGFDRVAREESLRHSHESRRSRKDPEPIPHDQVRHRWHGLLLEVVERRSEQELDLVVCSPRAVYHGLRGNDSVFGVKQKRLLRRKMPFLSESRLTIPRTKLPERRVPWRGIAGTGTRG